MLTVPEAELLATAPVVDSPTTLQVSWRAEPSDQWRPDHRVLAAHSSAREVP
jgi:hypothetical protein